MIERHPLFAGVTPEILASLAANCELRRLQVGEVLLAPGQLNASLYLLLAGRLRVDIERLGSHDGPAIEPGECTGEISVVDRGPATAFVVADLPSLVMVLPDDRLWESFALSPGVARNFVRLFANRLRARAEAMHKALEKQLRYEHLQKELAIARDIQLGMVPHDLRLTPEIEIAASMTPAQEVGGDFYDVFPVGTDDYCIVIGDVSGKGVAAALFMVQTLTLLRAELAKGGPIEEGLRRLNAALCANNAAGMFATLVVGVLSAASGRLRHVNAGHDPLILGEAGASYRPLPPPKGILVGIDETARYEVSSVGLSVGDVVVFYTDGVTEAMNPEAEPFTTTRLLECLARAPVSSAEALVQHLDREVREFARGAPQSDDLTTVIVRYLGGHSGETLGFA